MGGGGVVSVSELVLAAGVIILKNSTLYLAFASHIYILKIRLEHIQSAQNLTYYSNPTLSLRVDIRLISQMKLTEWSGTSWWQGIGPKTRTWLKNKRGAYWLTYREVPRWSWVH